MILPGSLLLAVGAAGSECSADGPVFLLGRNGRVCTSASLYGRPSQQAASVVLCGELKCAVGSMSNIDVMIICGCPVFWCRARAGVFCHLHPVLYGIEDWGASIGMAVRAGVAHGCGMCGLGTSCA